MSDRQRGHRTHLFTLRIWPEPLGDGRVEWRGKVQHVLSGEAHYFRDWPGLIDLMQQMGASIKKDSRARGEEI
jgi:hypothetical protein